MSDGWVNPISGDTLKEIVNEYRRQLVVSDDDTVYLEFSVEKDSPFTIKARAVGKSGVNP